ncbi:hypothetical protein GGF32_008411 [Allomyces javanicus]|nr:hypothetical protein GGF32_008411 [Allomyces javanicus]
MSPRVNTSDSTGHADEPLSTLDAILVASSVIAVILVFVNAIAVGAFQHHTKERAEIIEKKFRLERGPPKDEDGDEIMPKGQYWYTWLAAKARGLPTPVSILNQGGIAISMPSLPPPPYLTDGGKSTIPLPQYTTTQPTGPVSATARCRPYDVDGTHLGIAANTKGAELQFHRVATHAFVDPDAKPGARLEVRFPESIVAPADTQEIDQGLETVNKVVAAKRPSLLVLRLFSILVLALWLGGIAIFLNAVLAKSNDRMWVTGPLHWPGKQQQQFVGLLTFVAGWHVLIVGVWYEMRLAIATRVAIAQLNHDGARYRWHFCMPPAAKGHPKSYVFSPLRMGQGPIMVASLVCLLCNDVPLPCCCCDDDEKEEQKGPIWESWAKPLETEWIISVRAAPPAGYAPAPMMGQPAPATGYAPAPMMGSQPAPATGYAPALMTGYSPTANAGFAATPVGYVQQPVTSSNQPFSPAW